MKRWILLLSLLFTFLPLSLLCDDSDPAQQISLEAYPKWYSQDDLSIQGNIGVKKLFHEHNWITYYVKPSTTYALDYHFAVHGGLGFYYTSNKEVSNIRELRPFLGLSHFINFTDKWAISSYFRVEERYFDSMGTDDRSVNTRLRLRFRQAYKLNPKYSFFSWKKLTLDLEGFKSYNKETTFTHTYDYETRITLGIERKVNEERKIRFELAWKYKTQARQISESDIHTIFFKIQYFPSWGSQLRNRLNDRDIDE